MNLQKNNRRKDEEVPCEGQGVGDSVCTFQVKKVPRKENVEADRLARIGSGREELEGSGEQVRLLPSPAILGVTPRK